MDRKVEEFDVSADQRASAARRRATRSAIRGSLLGGAIGDALGAPIEFMDLADIRREFGPSGLTGFQPAYGRDGGAVTDDTQMTLFTAEGLIRADNRSKSRGSCHTPSVVWHAYQRWFETQGGHVKPELLDGWLFTNRWLHHRRAPGNSCMSALAGGVMGTRDQPVNDSKGCGGVMRMAPVGMSVARDPFDVGCDFAAITHGHASGFIAAGAFAQIIAELTVGEPLVEAVRRAASQAAGTVGGDEVADALTMALDLAGDGGHAESIERLGGGWVAEEALAISVYCALARDGFEEAVLLAVNHGGDSDSTGAITGNLMGVVLGEDALPKRWLDRLEGRETISEVADDLFNHFHTDRYGDVTDGDRYPGR